MNVTDFEFDHTSDVLSEVSAERDYQRSHFGNDQDNSNTASLWTMFIVGYLGKAYQRKFDAKHFRKMMVKVAALAVAAVEWVDRTQPTAYRDDGVPTTTDGYAKRPS